MYRILCFLLLLLLVPVISGTLGYAQVPPIAKDTLSRTKRFQPGALANNLLLQAWTSLQRPSNDTGEQAVSSLVLLTPAEEYFAPFAGRVIRYIALSRFSFDRIFTDTSSRITSKAADLASTLHKTTRAWVIRNNLFQKEGSRINPYILADNERFLRTLDYLQDARILVQPILGTDSVDLLVITKDLFSIKLTIDNDGYDAGRTRLSEENFLGMGQKIQGTILFNPVRNPEFGYGFEYSKNNIGGSFANGYLSYNNIDIGRSLGFEPEAANSLIVQRPLPSPYSYYAAGLELSQNKALNAYGDTSFIPYAYNIYDFWAGYNLSLQHIMKFDATVRDRKFFSLRYYQRYFYNCPDYFGQKFDPIYNNITALLGQLTFFKQDYIKTQYLYGFGVTEDIPYGYNLSLTAGWWKQLYLERPYVGIVGDYYTTAKRGSFGQYYLRAGSFFERGGRWSDAVLMLGLTRYSRLFVPTPKLKIRQYFRGTYARVFNSISSEPLRINNVFGLRDFGSDSAEGNERISFRTETIFYLNKTILGFHFAPFVFLDAALLRQVPDKYADANFYPGFGGGLRMRNENFVFGTLEFKAGVFPRNVPGQSSFKFLIASDLRYKYRSAYIHPPDIVRLNTDDW